MANLQYIIRIAQKNEFEEIGRLLVNVYSQLRGFPKPSEQPEYFQMLAGIGRLTENPGTSLLIAASPKGEIVGAVVYFNDMQYYGSGGSATLEKHAAGFRLLAVNPATRGLGLGKLLTKECIFKAREDKCQQVIIHSTEYMKIAWKMYEDLGFIRSPDLDFSQNGLPVYGFRLKL